MNDAEEPLLRELAEVLATAFADAVVDARRKHAGEHFYAYVLYALPLFDYAVLLFNTEEGLARITSDHGRRSELRWSPPEWECRPDDEKLFERVNDILGSLMRVQGYEQAACDKRRKVFIDVLKLLDVHGLFGTGAARESALVNIMWGDQDVRHIESARELNPMASYIEYAKHELPSLYAWAKVIEDSQSMYKDEALARIRHTIAHVESNLPTGL